MRSNSKQSFDAIELVDSGDMKETIYLLLKKMIMKREFTPNERLDPNEISKRLGISRTPVRDALNMLSAEGFITTLARKGTFVTGIYKEDLIQMFQYREMIEIYSLNLGFPILLQSANVMRDIIDKWELELKSTKYDGSVIMKSDVEIHQLIVNSARNSKISKSYEALNCHVQTARGYYLQDIIRINASNLEHKAIFEAIVEGNKLKTEQKLKEHLDNTLSSLLNMIEIFKVF